MSTLVIGLGEVLWDLLPTGRQLGGAPANFAYHCRLLGAEARVVSAVGDDELGRDLLAALAAAGLVTDEVACLSSWPTSTVSVALAAGEPRYTIHEGVAWDHLPWTPALAQLAERAEAVCCGTLAQRTPGSRQAIQQFLRHTRPACLRVLDVNLRGDYYDAELLDASLRLANVLKLNDHELPVVTRLLGLAGDDPLTELTERYSLLAVALTCGEHGCELRAGEQVVRHPCFTPRQVADTVGAGDAFTAALVMGLLSGRSLLKIANWACALASWVCEHPGAMPAGPPRLATD